MYNSDARQDQFVANLLKFKNNGYYLDIGSNNAVLHNNSFFLESLDWKGICIEIASIFNDSYKIRTCRYINNDAAKIDYSDLLESLNFPKNIDYLSLDVDELSSDVLMLLPFDQYVFSVITIEHDAYLYGDTYRAKQRQYLFGKGYELICSNVYVEQPEYGKPECPFEDWWVHPSVFDSEYIKKIYAESNYPSEIIKKFG